MKDSNTILRKSIRTVTVSPRVETAGPLLMTGLPTLLDAHAVQKIPQLWQEFVAHQHALTQRVGGESYGLCIHLQGDEYQYVAACAVWDFNGLPNTFSTFVIPAQEYAVFSHEGSVTHIKETIDFAFDQWLPNSTYHHATNAENPLHFFERYGEKFDPHTGKGDIEIWLPIITNR